MKIYQASYYEIMGEDFREYERVVVAENELGALEELMNNDYPTKVENWVLVEISTDEPCVIEIWNNYSE